jgi:hypothetical protein
VRQSGTSEGWLGRSDVLLVLDLPGGLSVATALGLVPAHVQPVLLLGQWPEPGGLLTADEALAVLLAVEPPRPRRRAQYAFVLERERSLVATPQMLAARFDNRYDLGEIDWPRPERLRAGGIAGVVAAEPAGAPPAPDLVSYLDTLGRAALPVRRLAL